jgi:putative phosphoesterase
MRLGILSDTHDRLERTRAAVKLLCDEGADVLIHCGDLTGPEIVVACVVAPAYFVFGNHDADSVPVLEKAISEAGAVCFGWGGEVTLCGKRVAVVHGHIGVRRRLATEPDYLLSGHFHIASDRREGRTRWINPGALDEADEFTVALLDVERDNLQFLRIPT